MEKSIHRLPIYIHIYIYIYIYIYVCMVNLIFSCFYFMFSYLFVLKKGFNVSLIYLNSGVFLKNIKYIERWN